MPVLTESEVISELNTLKQKGNDLFKAQNYSEALETYENAIKINNDQYPEEYEKYLEKIEQDRIEDSKISKSAEENETATPAPKDISEFKEMSPRFHLLAILHQNAAACCQKLEVTDPKEYKNLAMGYCEIAMNYNPIYVKNLQRLAQIYYLEGTMEEITTTEKKG